MAAPTQGKTKLIVKNRKAFHNFEVLDRFEAGISLVGTEAKSLRAGNVKITEAFCNITEDIQLELRNLHISHYDFGNRHNHETNRTRKLLMHKQEIIRLYAKIREKGLTLIPISLYFKQSRVKVEIALCRGKKLHDKRATIRDKDIKRDVDRALKQQD
ncbi:MAG: SsrA-binding protein [bacterium]|jgi:SsrA-binding protein